MSLRRIAPLLLALPVLAAHVGVGEMVHRWDADLRADTAAPPPISVSFVEEMKPKQVLSGPKAHARIEGSRLDALGADRALSLPPDVPAPNVPPPPDPVASAPGPTTAQAQDGEPGPEWPLSTRLDYTLTGYYRGEVTGSANVEWRRDGSHYQVALEFSVGGIVSRSMVSDGRLGAKGIEPQRYDETTKIVLMSPRRASMSFGGTGQQLQLANGNVMVQPAGVQDTASQFIHLTWLFLTGRAELKPGTAVDIPLALPRKLYPWRYTVKEQELLYTPLGEMWAWHLVPSRVDAPINGDLTADVWLAPTLQYLPVRILIRQDAETYVDLLLARAPRQAAEPQSSPSK
ncbi:DUF3108 domain-containing protein [Burkholderiaceae bacterium UC74_6]